MDGNETVVNPEQPSKLSIPILVTNGNETDVNPVQFWKARSPILVNEVADVESTEVNAVQLLKQLFPKVITSEPNATLVNVLSLPYDDDVIVEPEN